MSVGAPARAMPRNFSIQTRSGWVCLLPCTMQVDLTSKRVVDFNTAKVGRVLRLSEHCGLHLVMLST
jgi:hypothetical protein